MTDLTKKLATLGFVLSALAVSACNTVEGAGKDIKQTGQAIEETAEETNDGNPRTP